MDRKRPDPAPPPRKEGGLKDDKATPAPASNPRAEEAAPTERGDRESGMLGEG